MAPALVALIDANARLWAAEAEVCATYFRSPSRTASTDEAWLARQCYKEIVDGVVGQMARLIDDGNDTAAVLADEVIVAETNHYAAFARAHRIAGAEAGLEPHVLRQRRLAANWPENVALQSLRADHRREFGWLGERASAFTEGGYCTLYTEGTRLTGSRRDDAISAACAVVIDDEWDHMLSGIAGLANLDVSTTDWQRLHELTVAQSRLRIRMRNVQLGNPLPEARIRALEAGELPPLPFDYRRAGLGV